MENSFAALRDSDLLTLDISISSAVFTESVYPDLFDYGIEPLFIFSGTIASAYSHDRDIPTPFSSVRIEARTHPENEILALSSKFPLGWLECGAETTNIVLHVRPNLSSSIGQHLSLISDSGLEIQVTIPLQDSYTTGFYPVLSYTYRARSQTRRA